jgi:hypothetical protein
MMFSRIKLQLRYWLQNLLSTRVFVTNLRISKKKSESWMATPLNKYLENLISYLRNELKDQKYNKMIEIGVGNANIAHSLMKSSEHEFYYLGYEIDKTLYKVAEEKLKEFPNCELVNDRLDANTNVKLDSEKKLVFLRSLLGCMDQESQIDLLHNLNLLQADKYIFVERLRFHKFDRLLDFNMRNVSVNVCQFEDIFPYYTIKIMRIHERDRPSLQLFGSNYILELSKIE